MCLLHVGQAVQAVSDEIPFELFWPMVKDDIVRHLRLPATFRSTNTEKARERANHVQE